jgi:hypothetical protein
MVTMRLSALILFSLSTYSCRDHATFMAAESVPILEKPNRSHSTPNPVVGTLEAGVVIVDAVVVGGVDFRYFRVELPDSGVGYVRNDRVKLHVYAETHYW